MNETTYAAAAELIRNDDAYLRLRPFKPDRPDEPAQLILGNRMWFSDISIQDDIFEGRPIFKWRRQPTTSSELEELIARHAANLTASQRGALLERMLNNLEHPEMLALAKREMETASSRLYQSSSIACFFKDVLGTRSWVTYADGGRGYGLVFDLSIPWHFEAFSGFGPTAMMPFPIEYVPPDRRPAIELAFAPCEPAFEDIQRAVLTKAEEWKDQREQRFVRVGVPSGFVEFPPESLKALVLGHAIEPVDAANLLDLVRKRQIPIAVYQAKRSATHLALELHAVDPFDGNAEIG